MSKFLDKCRSALRATPVALIPCRRHENAAPAPADATATRSGELNGAASQWLNYWRSLGHNVVSHPDGEHGLYRRTLMLSELDGFDQSFLEPHLAIHNDGQRDGATRAAEVMLRSIPGLQDAVFALVAEERPPSWAEAYRRYLDLRAASDALAIDEEGGDAAIDAYCEAMDDLIDLPSPSTHEARIKIDLATERGRDFGAMLDEHGAAIIADLLRLAEARPVLPTWSAVQRVVNDKDQFVLPAIPDTVSPDLKRLIDSYVGCWHGTGEDVSERWGEAAIAVHQFAPLSTADLAAKLIVAIHFRDPEGRGPAFAIEAPASPHDRLAVEMELACLDALIAAADAREA